MDRRAFLQGLAIALAAPPWARALAAEPALVGLLALGTASGFRSRAEAFTRAMKEAGHAPGKSVRYEWRYAEDEPARVEGLARDLVALRPAVVVADSALATLRLRQASTEVPIVMAGVEDPAGHRFVRSLAAPQTNATGITTGSPDAILQAVHYLDAVLKKGATVAMIFTQNNAHYRKLRARFRHAALEDGMQPLMIDANNRGEIERAFAEARQEKAAGLVIMGDPMFFDERARIVRLAAAARLPAMYPDVAFVRAGGLMSYGPDVHAAFTRAASFAARILAGEKAADLPLEEPRQFRLAVNRRTARAVAISIPPALLRDAEVIG